MLEFRKISRTEIAEPQTWSPIKREDKLYNAKVICPSGHSGSIANSNIQPTGIVTPSVVCVGLRCKFRAQIILIDWRDRDES